MLRNLYWNFRSVSKFQRQSATNTTHFNLFSSSSANEEVTTPADQHQRPGPGNHHRPGYLPHYTTEQSDRILEILNKKNLQGYEISKARAGKLLAWQIRHGPLKQVQDILQVEGFGVKVAEKFCRSLLDGPATKMVTAKTSRARSAPFITPSLSTDQQKRIRSCVSVRIGVASVTWARLEMSAEHGPCRLTEWQHHDITERKLHLNDLVQRCLYIDHLIPLADCYLFESPQTAAASNNPGNTEQQNINIQKSQIAAMLSYALSARGRIRGREEDNEHLLWKDDAAAVTIDGEESMKPTTGATARQPNVFYLRRFLTARLFSHLIGTERVSSEQSILNLMRTYYNTEQQADFLLEEKEKEPDVANSLSSVISDDVEDASPQRLSFRGNVQFPSDLRDMFARAERFHREFLGQALLLNLSFVRLVLLQDPQSIAVVSRNSNKDKDAATMDK